MKKIFVLLTVFCIFLGAVEVNAACGVSAWADNEMVCLAKGTKDFKFNGTLQSDDGTLILNNYNGGSIKFSTGIGGEEIPDVIKLVGDNFIVAEDSYGIGAYSGGVVFVGDGTLTIKSKLPIATISNNPNHTVILSDTVNVIKILAGDKAIDSQEVIDTEENEIIEETVVPVDENELDWSLILVAVCCTISVICVIVVITTVTANKKKK